MEVAIQEKNGGGTTNLKETDILDIVSSMREPIEQSRLDRFLSGDLSAIKIHCVDGRPDMNPTEVCLRRFGGPFGLIVNLIGALREVKQEVKPEERKTILKIVKERLGMDGLLYHSDDHHHDHSGCGYVNSVMTDPNAFGLTEEDCHYFDIMLSLMQRIDVVGQHDELAVLIVDTHELIKKDPAQQFFVWNRQLDEVVLTELCFDVAKALNIDEDLYFTTTIERRNKNAKVTLEKLKIQEKGLLTVVIK